MQNNDSMNEGFVAYCYGRDMISDNPYECYSSAYWDWRAGYINGFKAENF